MAALSPPLDYSFRELASVEELGRRGPRRGVRRYPRALSGRYRCHALRLNNNRIVSMRGLYTAALQVLDQPELLTWLDLSFNALTTVSSELALFANLKILYLHGNLLTGLAHILKVLQQLSQLYNLTLHGNPIETKKGYRTKVLSTLIQLRCLDFINVTKSDRQRSIAIANKKASKSNNAK